MKRVFQTHSGETTPLPASMPQTARPAQGEVNSRFTSIGALEAAPLAAGAVFVSYASLADGVRRRSADGGAWSKLDL